MGRYCAIWYIFAVPLNPRQGKVHSWISVVPATRCGVSGCLSLLLPPVYIYIYTYIYIYIHKYVYIYREREREREREIEPVVTQ